MLNNEFSPGLYADIPFEEYLQGPGMSKHGLDLIAKSPFHFINKEDADTQSLRMGRALHCAVLEPHRFAEDYAPLITVDRRTKEGKARWEAYIEENEGKILLNPDEHEKVRRMAEGVCTHPAASALLTGGHREVTAYWEDRDTGLLCRCRPDFLNEEMTLVADLKTCASASPGAFARAVNNYRYHVQDGWYRDGLKALGCPVEHFVFICVENTPPHAVACYVLEPAAVDLGRELYRRDLNTYTTWNVTLPMLRAGLI
ncbi:PD-(D/E)XK nuclease-like domain-containing protein [Nitrosococcus wardiae]|nr:PD-(D/E)XK nuclease-like domain-containing protein [Nitrosococcus wardiae]